MKFNGKRDNSRNLAEVVLHRSFGTSGIGKRIVKRKKRAAPKEVVQEYEYGGAITGWRPPSHDPWAIQQRPSVQQGVFGNIPQGFGEAIPEQVNPYGGTLKPMTPLLSQEPLGGYNKSLQDSNLKSPARMKRLEKPYPEEVAMSGLSPAEVANAQAEFLKKEGLKSMGFQALGAVGTMISQSDDTTKDVRPEFTGRDALGSFTSGAASGAALGPWGAAIGGVASLAMSAYGAKKAGEAWDEGKIENRNNRATMQGQAAQEYSQTMKGTYNSQGGGGYYGKYGGAVSSLLQKYGYGGGTLPGAGNPVGSEGAMYDDINTASRLYKYKRRANVIKRLPFQVEGWTRKNRNHLKESRAAHNSLKMGSSAGFDWSTNFNNTGELNKYVVQKGNTDPFYIENIRKDHSGSELGALGYNSRQVIRDLKNLSIPSNQSKSFALGGPTRTPNGNADYQTEGGEVMLASPGDSPLSVGNGKYTRKASNLFKAVGPKHTQGGIDTKGATEPFVDAMGNPHNSPYIFSDAKDMQFDATDILNMIL